MVKLMWINLLRVQGLSNVSISNGNTEEFINVKFTAKMDVQIGYFMLPLLMLKSPYMFNKFLYHMLVKFEQNCMVRTLKKKKKKRPHHHLLYLSDPLYILLKLQRIMIILKILIFTPHIQPLYVRCVCAV